MRFPFSNFYEFDEPMPYQGMFFRTPENFYQAMKTLDTQKRYAISKMTPSQAKKFAKTVPLRPNWDAIKLDVMRYVQEYRFRPGTSWRKKLVAYDGLIIERNLHHDNYWGDCSCTLLTNPPYGRYMTCKGGQNHLGKILTAIRDRIRIEEQDTTKPTVCASCGTEFWDRGHRVGDVLYCNSCYWDWCREREGDATDLL